MVKAIDQREPQTWAFKRPRLRWEILDRVWKWSCSPRCVCGNTGKHFSGVLQLNSWGEKKIAFPGGDTGKTIFMQTCLVDCVNKGTAAPSSPGGRCVSTWEKDGWGTDGGARVLSTIDMNSDPQKKTEKWQEKQQKVQEGCVDRIKVWIYFHLSIHWTGVPECSKRKHRTVC